MSLLSPPSSSSSSTLAAALYQHPFVVEERKKLKKLEKKLLLGAASSSPSSSSSSSQEPPFKEETATFRRSSAADCHYEASRRTATRMPTAAVATLTTTAAAIAPTTKTAATTAAARWEQATPCINSCRKTHALKSNSCKKSNNKSLLTVVFATFFVASLLQKTALAATPGVPTVQLGSPLLVPNVEYGESRCFVAPLPSSKSPLGTDEAKVRIAASVVGLAGSPTLLYGWSLDSLQEEASEGTSYESVVLDIKQEKTEFYLCVRTLSLQGCDALLTVLAAPEWLKTAPMMVHMHSNYPSIWPISNSSEQGLRAMRFLLFLDALEDAEVSLTPISGILQMEVFLCKVTSRSPDEMQDCCSGTPHKIEKWISSPTVVETRHSQQGSLGILERALCVQLTSREDSLATASITIGTPFPGPFLVPAVPTGARFSGSHLVFPGLPNCEHMRLLINAGTDMTITAISEDRVHLKLSASLNSDNPMASVSDRWTGETTAGGGDGAVLVIDGRDIKNASYWLGEQGEVTLYLRICLMDVLQAGFTSAPFWVTATTDTDLVTLEDGVPFSTTSLNVVSDSGKNGSNSNKRSLPNRLWRDFRYFIPASKDMPREITLSASSTASKVSLVADTRRHPGKFAKYRWGATDQNTSHPFLRLTTSPALANDEVRLIDCRFPCFIYISAVAGSADIGSLDEDLTVEVETDTKTIKPLLEGQEASTSLPPNKSVIYRYRLERSGAVATLFSLAVAEGSASFRVSAVRNFEESTLTTRTAADIILLEPNSPVYAAAEAAAKPLGVAPVLFVMVSSTTDCEFKLLARAAGEAVELLNGQDVRGGVEPRGIDRYHIFLGEEETATTLDVTVELETLTGEPGLWISCEPNQFPRPEAYDWALEKGSTSVTFKTSDPKFRAGLVYVSVSGSGSIAAYSIRASWSSAEALTDKDAVVEEPVKKIELEDGLEELRSLTLGSTLRYDFRAESHGKDGPVRLRVEALAGSVSVCVLAHNLPGPAAKGPGCEHGIYKLAERHEAEQSKSKAEDDDDEDEEEKTNDAVDEHAVAAFDVSVSGGKPTVDDLCDDCIRIFVTAVGQDAEFSIRALRSKSILTVSEHHATVRDAVGPACCLPTPSSFSMLYQRFIKPPQPPADGSALGFNISLRARSTEEVELKVQLGKTSANVNPKTPILPVGAYLSKAHSPIGKMNILVMLDTLLIGTKDEAELRKQGFWIEVSLLAKAPTNYTLAFGDFSSYPSSLFFVGPLAPGKVVTGSLVAKQWTKVPFVGDDTISSDWLVHARSCYGGLTLYSNALGISQKAVRKHDFKVSSRGSGTDLLVSPDPGLNESNFELGWTLGAEAPTTFKNLTLPENDSVQPTWGKLGLESFSVYLATTTDSNVHQLRYTLLLGRRNDSDIVFETGCGLSEGWRRGYVVAGRPVILPASHKNASELRQTFLIPSLPETFKNRSLWVNVLVESLSTDHRPIASRSYDAFFADESTAAQLLPTEGSGGGERTVMTAMLVLLLLVACLAVRRRGGICVKECELPQQDTELGGPGGKSLVRDVELEVQYSSFPEGSPTESNGTDRPARTAREMTFRNGARSSYGYVPPSV